MYYRESCIFAEFPLDPCDHKRGDDKAIKELMNTKSARFLLYLNGDALMEKSNNQNPVYLSYENIQKCSMSDIIFLGEDKQHAYFACSSEGKNEQVPAGDFIDLRSVARQASQDGFSPIPSLLARGKMLLDWHARHQYCARCGAMSVSRKGGYVRHCASCDTEHFPRVDPVVIMMVIHKDKCLLGRSPHFMPGMYSALAGFMEPGETIEEAVRREVWEEAGIKIGNVEYVKSQPWPFPSSLMIGAIGQALNDDINLDNDELEEAKWFDKKTIAEVLKHGGDDQFRVPEKLAIARHLLEYHLMEHWIDD